MEITNKVTAEEYLGLRQSVGWSVFPVEQAQSGLDNSHVICIRDNGEAVAIARLIWDHGYAVLIADVIVLPEYQGQGLLSKLLGLCLRDGAVEIPDNFFVFKVQDILIFHSRCCLFFLYLAKKLSRYCIFQHCFSSSLKLLRHKQHYLPMLWWYINETIFLF